MGRVNDIGGHVHIAGRCTLYRQNRQDKAPGNQAYQVGDYHVDSCPPASKLPHQYQEDDHFKNEYQDFPDDKRENDIALQGMDRSVEPDVQDYLGDNIGNQEDNPGPSPPVAVQEENYSFDYQCY
jgi:hypothetical protein